MNGAQAAVKTLKAHGLRKLFGIPGIQNLDYFDAFDSEGMDVILVSHELGASFMADAFGRVTGEPGVVAVVPGPGLTNVFTGLGEALLDGAPVIVLVPGNRNNYKESYQLHEIDHRGAAESLTKCYIKADTVGAISDAVARAVQCAKSGEPGPVIVEVPYNVLMEPAPAEITPPYSLNTAVPEKMELDRAAEIILSARKPGIHAGAGAGGASELLMELATRLDAPVSTTISGRGVIPEDHDLSVGFGFGKAGTELAEKIFSDRDLVIAVGCKFSEVGSGSYGLDIPRMVHIDANPEVLGKNFEAEVMIPGDASQVLSELLNRIREERPELEDSELRKKIRAAHKSRHEKFEKMKKWDDSVNPARLLNELRKRLPRDAILTTDSGAHTFWTIFGFEAYQPNTVLSPIDYSSMGYSIPASIGASIAAPDRQVVAAVGDGGLLMTGTELITASRLGLPLKVLLFNDRALGLIKQTQERIYRKVVAVDTSGVDWKSFATSFGFGHVLIENDGSVSEGLDKALSMEGPVLIEAMVSYKKQTRHTKGTAMSYAKRTPPGVVARMAARGIWRTLFG